MASEWPANCAFGYAGADRVVSYARHSHLMSADRFPQAYALATSRCGLRGVSRGPHLQLPAHLQSAIRRFLGRLPFVRQILGTASPFHHKCFHHDHRPDARYLLQGTLVLSRAPVRQLGRLAKASPATPVSAVPVARCCSPGDSISLDFPRASSRPDMPTLGTYGTLHILRVAPAARAPAAVAC